MAMRRVAVVMALAGLLALLVTAPPAAGAPERAAQEARVDFNDDGFADLGVGARGRTWAVPPTPAP